MTSITCYDGVGCIGGNKILLEDGATRLWLDFGTNFGLMGKFYEEYLKPKGCLGIYEPIQMGLLPPIRDLYRCDQLCGLADPWTGLESHKIGDVAGILLSHAHMDHVGGLHYVREDIPIFSSAMTLATAKATQDTGANAPDQYCYTTPYEECDTGELKAAYYGRNPSVSRQYVFVDETPSDEFNEFWNATPGSLSEKGRKHESFPIAVTSSVGGLNLRRFPVDHSVYGACAWAIETSAGWVVYTGDIRCHGGNADLTWKFAEEAAKLKPIALIIEGTRIDSDSTYTEREVRDRALDEVAGTKGLVIADFGPRNVERLASFLEIARETGRKLLLLPKDVYLLEKMALASPDVPSMDDPAILVYAKYEASSNNWKKMLKGAYESRMMNARQVSESQDKAICCFSFFDVNELAYIRPVAGSTWIYSSCEPFSEDMQLDFDRLGEWIKLFDMGFPSGDPRQDESNPFHVSGHACREHLLKVIDIIDPQVVIPVHTEKPDLYAQSLAGRKVILPERGIPIAL